MKTFKNTKSGFTLLELGIVFIVLGFLFVTMITGFVSYRKDRSLIADTDAVIQQLYEARNLSLVSKGTTTYGVHFTSTTTTFFSGSSYSDGAAGNKVNYLSGGVTLVATLPGGGSDIIFSRINGSTNLSGTATIVLTTTNIASTTVSVYKTGTIERTN